MNQDITIIFGGESHERMVSVASAQYIAQTLKNARLWFWHADGHIFHIQHEQLLNHQDPFTKPFLPQQKPVFNSIIKAIESPLSHGHTFFLALHGSKGEDGYIQSILTQNKRAFTGSGALESQLAFDKIKTKEALVKSGIKLAPHAILNNNSQTSQMMKDFFITHGSMIVKPVCGGSSVDCYMIRDLASIDNFAMRTSKKTDLFMMEKVISGRELTVGVIENLQGLKALPCTEILIEKGHSFDYQGKYLGKGSKEITPASIENELSTKAQELAIMAHKGLNLKGYSRTDMILAHDGFYFIEINTLPGLSERSLIPQQLAAQGITISDFVQQQISLAYDENLLSRESMRES